MSKTLREHTEDELDESIARNPAGWSYEREHRATTVDWWLMVGIGYALRSVNLHRYRRDPAVQRAVREARAAVAKATRLMSRAYFEKMRDRP